MTDKFKHLSHSIKKIFKFKLKAGKYVFGDIETILNKHDYDNINENYEKSIVKYKYKNNNIYINDIGVKGNLKSNYGNYNFPITTGKFSIIPYELYNKKGTVIDFKTDFNISFNNPSGYIQIKGNESDNDFLIEYF